jgi:hypothetical protein
MAMPLKPLKQQTCDPNASEKKKNLPECSPSVRVERRKEREFGRYHHLNLVDRSI